MDTQLKNVPTRPAVAGTVEMAEWLDYTGGELIDRWRELAPALSQTIMDHPAILDGDEETAGAFAENLRMVAALRSAVADLHTEEKAPYLRLGRQVDAWKNLFTNVIDAAVEPLRVALRDFTIRRDKARIFEEREPVRGVYGSVASVRETWTYEIEDITKVPVEYLAVNDKLVKAVLADRHPKTKVPRRNIPGIKWVKQQNLAVS